MISAIEGLHADKFAHRDLKPENILFDENLNIRLIDFGLAGMIRDSQTLKTPCGSPNYAPPEIINGMHYGGTEADVWSCGIILYAMVCGSLPFEDRITNLKFKECQFSMPRRLSSEVKDLINGMM